MDMWKNGWRDEIWADLNQEWDLLVIGGGITGAGVFRAAAALGLKVLLVEARDFAFGTSSRSSKLVHGGFRYLYNRQYHVTFESVRQRERLLKEAPNLVTPLAFTLPNYTAYHFPSWMLRCGLDIYDLMAPRWDHQMLASQEVLLRFPNLRREGLLKGFRYKDAVLDDARLVLRVIREGVAEGGSALNYTRVESLLRNHSGKVCGVRLTDTAGLQERSAEVKAKAVINATGPWTDDLRAGLNVPGRLRKLRGSHLIFSRQRLPIQDALTIFHPVDRRAMFLLPWEGTTLAGTTDIDHDLGSQRSAPEPFASRVEIDYILEALNFIYPDLAINDGDILSSFAGLRPIISGCADSPSKESREHQVWVENGLVTVTGGKLTTFRLMAHQALDAALASIGADIRVSPKLRYINPLENILSNSLTSSQLAYLQGRYGSETSEMLAGIDQHDLEPIEQLPNLWAELRWAARSGGAVHLDDLLLRRVRLGMLLPEGGKAVLPRVRTIVQKETGWDGARWQAEEAAYWRTWKTCYSPDPG
jgi:glycerol-3-phosphate dehydrogenase